MTGATFRPCATSATTRRVNEIRRKFKNGGRHMDEEKVPSWVRATVALLIYIGMAYLMKVDLKLALLILVAYYELKRDREKWDG
jgi:hypothetical protein